MVCKQLSACKCPGNSFLGNRWGHLLCETSRPVLRGYFSEQGSCWIRGRPRLLRLLWRKETIFLAFSCQQTLAFLYSNKWTKIKIKITIYEQFPAKPATVSPWSLEDTYRAKPTWTSRPVLRGYFSVRGSCWIRGRPRLLRLLWRKETAFLAFSCRQTLALRGSVFIEPFNLLKQDSSQFFPTILIYSVF